MSRTTRPGVSVCLSTDSFDLYRSPRSTRRCGHRGFLVETELGRPSFRMEIREVPRNAGSLEKREQELFLKDKSESVLYRFIVPFAYFSAGPGKDDILRLYPVRLMIDKEFSLPASDQCYIVIRQYMYGLFLEILLDRVQLERRR